MVSRTGAGVNRRQFIVRTAAGVVGVGLLGQTVPQRPARLRSVSKFLTQAYNGIMKGQAPRLYQPHTIHLGRPLFDAFKQEIDTNVRLVASGQQGPRIDVLRFKVCRVVPDGDALIARFVYPAGETLVLYPLASLA